MPPFKTGHVPHHYFDPRELEDGPQAQGLASVPPPGPPREVEHEPEVEEPHLDVDAAPPVTPPIAPTEARPVETRRKS